MLRILADNPDYALALDDLALLAHRLYGCSNLHVALSFLHGATLQLLCNSSCAIIFTSPKCAELPLFISDAVIVYHNGFQDSITILGFFYGFKLMPHVIPACKMADHGSFEAAEQSVITHREEKDGL